MLKKRSGFFNGSALAFAVVLFLLAVCACNFVMVKSGYSFVNVGYVPAGQQEVVNEYHELGLEL